MDDHHIIKIVNATCVLHNYLCTANMDVANVMARLNPQGAAYMQPQAMLQDLQECWIPFKAKCTESETSTRITSTHSIVLWHGREIEFIIISNIFTYLKLQVL